MGPRRSAERTGENLAAKPPGWQGFFVSKKSDEREALARRLDAGEITQAYYDERIARMKRGKGSVARRRAANYARPDRPPVQPREWRPGQGP